MLLAPAREFLLNPQVTGQTIARKVQFLQSKLFLNDQDLEEAFKQIGDPAGPKYFSTKRISTGVKFLTNPQLASKPMDVKVKYLKDKIGLSQEEVTQAFKMKDNLEKAAKAKAEADVKVKTEAEAAPAEAAGEPTAAGESAEAATAPELAASPEPAAAAEPEAAPEPAAAEKTSDGAAAEPPTPAVDA